MTFKAFDEFGNYYFCYSLGYDKENDSEDWLLVKTTEQNMIELEKKQNINYKFCDGKFKQR